MSRFTFTAGDHRWTVGYDEEMATYFARREPAYWPAPAALHPDAGSPRPARAADRLPRDFTVDHERRMTAAYGYNWQARLNHSPLLQAVDRRHRSLADTLRAAAHGHPLAAAPDLEDHNAHSPVETVIGGEHGDVRALEELQARLTAEHHLELPRCLIHLLDVERRDYLLETDLHAQGTVTQVEKPHRVTAATQAADRNAQTRSGG